MLAILCDTIQTVQAIHSVIAVVDLWGFDQEIVYHLND